MRPLRSLSLAGALAGALTFAAAPRPAHASRGGSFEGVGASLGLGVTYFVYGVSALGLVTDVANGLYLGLTGHVPRLASYTGVVVWSLHALIGVPIAVSARGSPNAVGQTAAMGYIALATGSLALSMVGLARRPPPVSVTPAALEAAHGTRVPALVLSAHF